MRRLLIGAIVVGCIGMGVRAQQRRSPPPVDDGGIAVRPVSPDIGRSDPGRKSDTDYWLDSQTVRLTARYEDAVITTERTHDGIVTARVADRNGNTTANLSVRSSVLQYAPTAGDPFLAANDSLERPTLEAASRQAYGLWKDGTAGLRWRRGLMRRNPDRDLEPIELRTEWGQNITAHATRTFNKSVRVKVKGQDHVYAGEVISTRLMRDGVEIGASVWFPTQQSFMWNIGGTKGSLDPEILATKNNGPGGWTFQVNAAWLNLQAIAFHHFASQPKPIAGNGRCGPSTGLVARVADFFMPALHANDQGCDWPFVWLNGTSYEPCCNRHDLCYAAYGCTWKTWWMVWTSWRCDVCNLIVYNCFAYGGDTWNPGDA